MSTDPGRLNHRLVLEMPVDDDDGAGGFTRSWQQADEFWAELKPVSADFITPHGSAAQKFTHSVHYRSGPVLSTDKRLREGERIFTILHVRDSEKTASRKIAFVEEQTA